jgi:hypothetical protein
MKVLFDLFLILFAGFWLFMATHGTNRELNSYGRKSKWLLALPGLVGLVGFGGFFAQAFSAEGIITLPRSYEWPAGYVSNVVRTPEGKYVVPLIPAGRVQLYSPDWHFLYGWNVSALGGEFRVVATSNGTVEVLTARGRHRYIFNENGDLLSSSDRTDANDSLPNNGESLIVPTPLLLWTFSSPFISIAVGTLGFLVLRFAKKLSGGARAPTERELRGN